MKRMVVYAQPRMARDAYFPLQPSYVYFTPVEFKTVEKWITIVENVYYSYRIAAFGAPRIKAVKKEQKIYFWDWNELENNGAKCENFVASHLPKKLPLPRRLPW